MDLTPHHVGIIVGDLARSKAFYGALGFVTVDERVGEDKTLTFMRLGGLQVELFAYREPVPAAEVPGRSLGFRHLALETADIDAAYAELLELGVIGPGVQIAEYPGGWRLPFFHDPDGVEIEIKQA
ncbi:MAG: VOC family protein [Actinomycetota bacterium]|nr:VOC family protein [Actinomycetota bacterium]